MKEKILFVGCGKMGSVLLGGFLKKLQSENQVVVVKPNILVPINNIDTNISVISNIRDLSPSFKPDIIIFAVKPQIIDNVIFDYIKFEESIFISIIAGKKIDFFSKKLGKDSKIIRTMPNLPSLIGHGITALYGNLNISNKEKTLVNDLFKTVGEIVNLESEDEIDSVTSISGSGPAYVFHFAESLINSGMELGLSEEVSKKLALKTMLGSCLMMEQSLFNPTELKDQVTSKKGTTEAALNSLYENNFEKIVKNATKSAFKRSKELS